MKRTFIFLIILSCFLAACSSSQNIASPPKMEIVNATYSQWSKPPRAGSDIPERGVDLTIRIRNWPQKYKPAYLVYNKRKSLSATLVDSANNSVTITARIVRASSVLAETSESVTVSDRLVFLNPDGDTGFIKIDNWHHPNE